MNFRNYQDEDYQAVCDFLTELNRDGNQHINWNWARFEWMYGHPEFDRNLKNAIGLWEENGRIVGAAIYDMYFGEGFCGALPDYEYLYPEILSYACKELSDDSGFGFAICDSDARLTGIALEAGFVRTEQAENMLRIPLDRDYASRLPDGMTFAELDPVKELYEFLWLLWQGFDHGPDKDEFELENGLSDGIPEISSFRAHFNPYLSIAAVDRTDKGNIRCSYCCLWYDSRTDYAYVEPVCTVPDYRGKGISKAVIYEALGRAKSLGAKCAYVISDMEFYRKLGFEYDSHFTFYRKK